MTTSNVTIAGSVSPRGSALRARLVSGFSLALLIFGLLLVDGQLATREAGASVSPLLRWAHNGLICTLIVLTFALLATRELIRFARATQHSNPFPKVAYFFAAGLVVGPFISFNLAASTPGHDESWGMMWLAIALACAFYLQAAYRRSEHAMVNLASTIFIIFYAGGLSGYMTKLRMEVGGNTGMVVLLFSMFIVKMTDVGAYFVGSAFGRHKLIEWLSPKKTWEGLFGGVAVAVLSSLAVGSWLHASGLARLEGAWLAYPGGLIVLGVIMAAAAIAGDLFASLLKRDAMMKDSGHSIPGMGGILDVLDSPLLAAPLAWFFWTRLASY